MTRSNPTLANGGNMRIGFFVETPITREKKMYGAQLSLVTMVSELMRLDVSPFVVVSEEWEMTEALREVGANVLISPIWEFFKSIDGVYSSVHDPAWQTEVEQRSELRITEHFRDNGIQLVHMNTRFAGLLGARVARNLGLPYVFHIREFLAEDFGLAFKDERVANELVGGADSLIAISQSVRDSLDVEYPGATVDLIYNGIDVGTYSTHATTRFGGKKARLALVGRVVEHKGQFEAIRAIESLSNATRAGVELHIVGCRPEEMTPYEELLRNYVVERSLDDAVKFVPFTSDVPNLLRGFDIGLMCSGKEAFGRVTVEYMLSRLLVIGAASGGTVELVSDGEDGLLYEPGNYLELARQIEVAISDPIRANEMIEAAHAKAMASFPSSLNASRVREIYCRLLEQGARA